MLPLLVGDVLSLAAHRTPNGVAASMGDTELRFAELETDTQRLTRALAGQGLTIGDRIVWCGSTTIAAIPLWFAAARLGVGFIPINPGSTKREVDEILGELTRSSWSETNCPLALRQLANCTAMRL